MWPDRKGKGERGKGPGARGQGPGTGQKPWGLNLCPQRSGAEGETRATLMVLFTAHCSPRRGVCPHGGGIRGSNRSTIAQPLLNYCLTTAQQLLNYCLTTAQQLLNYCLTIAQQLLGHRLTIAWLLLGYRPSPNPPINGPVQKTKYSISTRKWAYQGL